ncbi:unnamed protein product [Moneuplotes crassus]|uniref:Uncharacterized protein n=3 Tax=Euplotes crassus TaxID=5936 RepID=A0AAD1X9F5_EUPCR|nr:unnamed protein product [Moneuplotes crassus]
MEDKSQTPNFEDTQIVDTPVEVTQNDELESKEPLKDDVNLKSEEPEVKETCVQEKLIYYCSSFDLNVKEWYSEYENVEIFKRRMKKLGRNWIKLVYQAVETTSQISSESGIESDELESEDTEDNINSHCLNVAIEFYLTSAKKKEEDSFEDFHIGLKEYFIKKGYIIVDEPLFESLAHTFHILAETEEDNISKKKTADKKFEEEYRKTKKRDKKMENKESNMEEEKDSNTDPKLVAKSRHRKYKTMIPGYNMIKKRIITPLLLASERVVEYWTPDQADGDKKDGTEKSSNEEEKLNDRMAKLSLEDLEKRKNRRRKTKCLRKSKRNINISKNLVDKASDCVDFISERMPVESKVTRNFVTNMIELSDSALKRISDSCEGIDSSESNNLNMRFIKPSKKFYNLLMSVWIKMDTTSIFEMTEDQFIENVKQALEKEGIEWSDAYLEPTNTFYNVAREEFMSLYQSQKDEASDQGVEPSNFIFSVTRFFASIKSTLLEMWHSEIVQKSAEFTAASSTDNVPEEQEKKEKEEQKKPSGES